MKAFGTILLILGIVILIWPVIIAYTIGAILVVLGANVLSAGAIFSQKPDSSIRFGDYEIFKKKK